MTTYKWLDKLNWATIQNTKTTKANSASVVAKSCSYSSKSGTTAVCLKHMSNCKGFNSSVTWTSPMRESWEGGIVLQGCSATACQSTAACSSTYTDSAHGKTAHHKNNNWLGKNTELESSQSLHTSAKAILFARRQHHLRFCSGFPYAPLKAMVTKISKRSRMQDSFRITPEIESPVVCAMPDIPSKFQKDPSITFWVILLTDRQTNKQSLAKTLPPWRR